MSQTNYWIDTHAHIYADEFDTDRAEMMQRAEDNSIGKIFMPNIDHTSIDGMLERERKYPSVCYPMMGLHPCYVKKDFEKELYLVESWLGKRKFSAVGEMGTDLYWDKTFWDQQVEAFTIQVGWAKKYDLPIVVHCRESIDETIALVEKLQDGKLKGVQIIKGEIASDREKERHRIDTLIGATNARFAAIESGCAIYHGTKHRRVTDPDAWAQTSDVSSGVSPSGK